jgi:hypothetical protein
METDSFFWQLLKQLPETLFALLGLPAEAAAAYRFDSVEIKKSYRLDGLFVPVKANLPVYFVEVQFRRARRFYANLLAKVFSYLDANDPNQDWQAVAFFGNRAAEPRPQPPYEDLLASPRVLHASHLCTVVIANDLRLKERAILRIRNQEVALFVSDAVVGTPTLVNTSMTVSSCLRSLIGTRCIPPTSFPALHQLYGRKLEPPITRCRHPSVNRPRIAPRTRWNRLVEPRSERGASRQTHFSPGHGSATPCNALRSSTRRSSAS